jgi:hypothetical protein
MVLGLTLCGAARAEGPTIPEGNWKLSFTANPGLEVTYFLIKVEKKDGKLTGSIAATPPGFPAFTLDRFSADGGKVSVALKGAAQIDFDGRTVSKDGNQVLGTLTLDGNLNRGRMVHTDLKELARTDVMTRTEQPEPMRKAAELTNRPLILGGQLRRAQTDEDKAKIRKEIEEANKEAQEKVPALYREVLEKHADSPDAIDAGLNLVRSAAKSSLKPDVVDQTVKALEKAAAPYGPAYQNEIATGVAESLATQGGYGPMAVEYARRAEKALGADAPAAQQVRVLKVLKKALDTAGQGDQAKEVDGRLTKLEEVIDQEYLKTVPPFKPATFAGRKAPGDRVVVMELFTGAQCPPCVAADVAFDGLEKTYKPKDLVLIQYHLHIPGPDPLTSPASLARQTYYGVNSTPTTLFNGKKDASGGGGMAQSEGKYKQYRDVIDPLLEKAAGAKVTGNVTRRGDKIDINVEVADLAEAAETTKLRLLLVEEQIRYVGGNKLRFHHQVVRAMPGGADGIALKEKTSRHAVSANLAELRQELTKYLDTYAAERAFPNPDRPMDLKHLKVIALVQDDKTKEILQAAEFDLANEAASR